MLPHVCKEGAGTSDSVLYRLARDRLRLEKIPDWSRTCAKATRYERVKMHVDSFPETRAPARHDSTRTTGDVARGRAADGAVLLVVEDTVGAALRVPAGERTAADTAAGTASERAAHGLGVLVGAVDAGEAVDARFA